jgi:hypothetical protein
MTVGTSDDPRAEIAAETAVKEALGGRIAALVMLFVAPTYAMPAIASAAARAAGGVPVVGCSTAGEIADGRGGSGRLVAIALGGGGLEVRTSPGLLTDGPTEAGRAVAQGLLGSELQRAGGTVLLFEVGFMLAGTVLPLSLVHRWGRTFLGRLPLLAGRGVPR